MRYPYYTTDVFTDHIFGGNQLAVLPDSRGLDDEQMQQVAREFNYSETVFVFPPNDPANTRRVRIFTPGGELPFAGHPTIGTAFVLALIGEVPLDGDLTHIVLEEGVGPVPVTIRAENGRPTFCQLTAAVPPSFGPPAPPADDLAAMLSLDPADLLGAPYEPQAASAGTPFMFIPLRSLDALGRARLNIERWEKTLADHWAPKVHIFTFEAGLPGSDLRCRMFAPSLGIREDPATGSAAAALAGYLGVRDERPDGTLHWVVEQGFEMGRPSILDVEADKVDGVVTAARVGGASVLVCEGVMEVPAAG
jgi:trans-2,3-dihydro-3-hydroxyanthranilate isomerase